MRERRHQNGSSNAHQRPGSTVSPTWAHRTATTLTAPSPRSHLSKEEALLSSRQVTAAPSKHAVVAASNEQRCATARAPTTTLEHAATRQQTSKRRIQSARGSSERKSHDNGLDEPNQAPQRISSQTAAPGVTPSTAVAPVVSDVDGVSYSQNGCQVQWAVKVNSADPTAASLSARKGNAVMRRAWEPRPTDPRGLEEFCSLLRDRYEGKRSLRAAFLNWDRDKDGCLNGADVRGMIDTLGFTSRLGTNKVEGIVEHIRSLPASSLRYEDFCAFIYGRPEAATGSVHSNRTAPAKSSTTTTTTVAAPESHKPLASSSDHALYPDTSHVVNLLRKKYASRKCRKVFRDWDADKDGCITMHELDCNLRQQGVRLAPNQVRAMLEHFDGDRDGRLQYAEFIDLIFGPVQDLHGKPTVQARVKKEAALRGSAHDPLLILRNSAIEKPMGVDDDMIRAAVQRQVKALTPHINDAYALFDDDHNGSLSYSDFRQGLKQLGLEFTEREFRHLAHAVDTDGSGEISYKEFSNLFNQKPGQTGSSGDGGSAVGHADSETLERDKAPLPRAAAFDFTHLTRKMKIPTRRGHAPVHDTSAMLWHVEGASNATATSRFTTETRLYGSGQQQHERTGDAAAIHHPTSTPAPATATKATTTTIGQEEKQRRSVNFVHRLQRIRAQQQDYDAKTAPLRDAYDQSQARRAQTLHRHQERYSRSIDEQHTHAHRQVASGHDLPA